MRGSLLFLVTSFVYLYGCFNADACIYVFKFDIGYWIG